MGWATGMYISRGIFTVCFLFLRCLSPKHSIFRVFGAVTQTLLLKSSLNGIPLSLLSEWRKHHRFVLIVVDSVGPETGESEVA